MPDYTTVVILRVPDRTGNGIWYQLARNVTFVSQSGLDLITTLTDLN